MTTHTGHTPGEWQVHYEHDATGYPCYFIHGFSGIDKCDSDLHESNMRLIAAAPELLIAAQMEDLFLQYVRGLVSADVLNIFLERHGYKLTAAPIDFISKYRRSAIAKATGKESA